MAQKKGIRETGPMGCYVHAGTQAITRCRYCHRPICKECAGDTPYPHSCPGCYPNYYAERMQSRERLKVMGVKVAAGLSIVLLFFCILFPVTYGYLWYRNEGEERIVPPEARAVFSSSDVYPVKEYDSPRFDGYAFYSFKVYMTNDYPTDCADLYLEIMVIQADTIVFESNRSIPRLGADRSEVFMFEGIPLWDDKYTVQFFLWQNGMVSVITHLDITIQDQSVSQLVRGAQELRPIPLDPGGVISAPRNPYDDYIWAVALVDSFAGCGLLALTIFLIASLKQKRGDGNDE